VPSPCIRAQVAEQSRAHVPESFGSGDLSCLLSIRLSKLARAVSKMLFTMKFSSAGVLFVNPSCIPRVDYDLMSLEQFGSVLKGG
jgi:hypothetical protein